MIDLRTVYRGPIDHIHHHGTGVVHVTIRHTCGCAHRERSVSFHATGPIVGNVWMLSNIRHAYKVIVGLN